MGKEFQIYKPFGADNGMKTYAYRLWAVVSLLAGVWVAVILLAPTAAATGHIGVSAPIYGFFGYICHQIPERSFFVFGHKFAVCSRCFGVYSGLLGGLALYPVFRSMDNPTPFPRVLLFLAMVPMAVDWSLGYFEIWENTHLSRLATGLMLGGMCAVFIVPALVEIAEIMRDRKRQARKSGLSSSAGT